jgi:hypothetical protein
LITTQEVFLHNSLYKILLIYKKKFLVVISTIASIAISDLHIQALLASMEFAHTHTHFVTNHHMKKCMSLIFD